MLTHEVAKVLERALGCGQFPLIRKRLYSRLQRICEQRGEDPLRIVSECLLGARSPTIRDPGKWFSAAVVRRLTEGGYWARPTDPNETQEQARALGQKLASGFTDAALEEGF